MDRMDSSHKSSSSHGRAYQYIAQQIDRAKGTDRDLVQMQSANEEAVVKSLSERFVRDLIYTSVGPILVSINPNKPMEDMMYSEDLVRFYSQVCIMDMFCVHVLPFAAMRLAQICFLCLCSLSSMILAILCPLIYSMWQHALTIEYGVGRGGKH
jgi:hypothetical protein